MSPISLSGHVVRIRKFSKKPRTIERLLKYEAITLDAAEFLKKLVQAKYNIIVSGGTGSGKTTFLNTISNFIPKGERIITIEDSAELQITEVDNLISLETRNSNSAGSGCITMRDLIKTSLRMRPERIIVGEVRGKEAIYMLQAMNTEHDGSLLTAHANTAYDMLSRLEVMVLLGSEIYTTFYSFYYYIYDARIGIKFNDTYIINIYCKNSCFNFIYICIFTC